MKESKKKKKLNQNTNKKEEKSIIGLKEKIQLKKHSN